LVLHADLWWSGAMIRTNTVAGAAQALRRGSLDEPPPIDRAHLARFTLGDQALETEVLQLFITQVPTYIGALKSADNDRTWKTAAHTLKGSARAVGAWELGDCAAEAEALLREPPGVRRQEIIALIEAAFARAARYARSLGSAPA